MRWYVYIARCGDESLYTGITTDPARRELAHNRGAGAAYTRARLPVRQPGSVRGWTCDARFDDIGTPRDYLDTSIRIAGGAPSALIDRTARVAPSARLERTIVWKDACVGDAAHLSDCIVTTGVRVRRGSRYHRAVLLPPDAAPAGPRDRVEGGVLVSPMSG